jgi:hypothetical protein
MSYDIYIGEAVLSLPGPDWNEIGVTVKGETLDDAPSFRGDSMTGRGNGRHPGYGAWAEFCRRVGLFEFFFAEETGMLVCHPGCKLLRPQDGETVAAALEAYRASHPDARPGWCRCKTCAKTSFDRDDDSQHEDLDGDLARLIWLDFWVRRALKRCDVPAMSNR